MFCIPFFVSLSRNFETNALLITFARSKQTIMANKRDIKKIVNSVIFDIVEESYSVQLFNESKAEASNKIIDAAATVQDELLSRISQAKSKADFKSIYADFENKTDELYDQVNKL